MARPPRADIDRELSELAALIAEHPAGITRPDLEAVYAAAHGRHLLKRTMNRRLAELEGQHRVRSEGGTGRASAVYFPVATTPVPVDTTGPVTAPAGPTRTTEATARAEVEPDNVPVSRDGAEVRELVRRPLAMREAVGYDVGLLESYVPGDTWYLPREVRAHLHEIGRTSETARPAGTFARELNENLLIDLAWASSRLEGNKYTRLDTRELIKFGRAATGADATETQMILNHKAAIEFLVERADQVGFNRYTVLNLHGALSENLLSSSADEGRLRRGLIGISGTVYRPLDVPQKIEEYFDLILAKAAAIPDPFEQAFFVMVHLPYLQPFMDVNKRTSRLTANIPLIKENLCPLSFIGLPEQAYVEGTLGVYELVRIELLRDVFVAAYERSCERYRAVREKMGAPDPIRLQYRDALRGVVTAVVQDGLPPQADVVRQWAVANGVPVEDHDAFVERAVGLLDALDETAAYRYRLTESGVRAWVARHRP
jgi:hypothetical protein